MTRAEWDALSAREKDAVVAEKVMGLDVAPEGRHDWDAGEYSDSYPYCLVKLCRRCRDSWKSCCDSEPSPPCVPPFPPFTTSWDAMRQVVEKMEASGHICELYHGWMSPQAPDGRKWVASFGTEDDYYATPADSAPEAVCLAALTALGHMEAA